MSTATSDLVASVLFVVVIVVAVFPGPGFVSAGSRSRRSVGLGSGDNSGDFWLKSLSGVVVVVPEAVLLRVKSDPTYGVDIDEVRSFCSKYFW